MLATAVWGLGLALRLLGAGEEEIGLRLPMGPRSGPADSASLGPIPPLDPIDGLDARRVALGDRLFHEPGLSGDGTISCSSCHDIESGGDDGRPVAIGIRGQAGTRNAPSVLTAALNFRQFWDGRVTSLETQAALPITNPEEMGAEWGQVLTWLRAQSSYRKAFGEIYEDGVTKMSVCDALAEFQRSLIPLDSPFDRHLRNEQPLDRVAQRGYETFVSLGCIACHQGRAVGGNLFQRFGIFESPLKLLDGDSEPDFGRFRITGKETDKFVFKVPSLRNVAETAPYLHDGSIQSLSETVRVMGRFQLGVQIREDDVQDIVAFLESLTGRPAR